MDEKHYYANGQWQVFQPFIRDYPMSRYQKKLSPATRRPWTSHEEEDNNEKTDTEYTILIQSANTASSVLMQWSHETMFAVDIFKIYHQLLEALPQTATGAPTLGPTGGLLFPDPHVLHLSFRLLLDVQVSTAIFHPCMIQS